MTSTPATPAPKSGRAARTVYAVLTAAVASAIVVAAIAAIAHALGARHDFKPLQPAAYLPLTFFGVVAGAIGWEIVRRRAARPAVVLRRLVPIVVALSLVPDIAVGASHSQPGTTWGSVAALMVMHLAVASIAVAAFQRLLPAA